MKKEASQPYNQSTSHGIQLQTKNESKRKRPKAYGRCGVERFGMVQVLQDSFAFAFACEKKIKWIRI